MEKKNPISGARRYYDNAKEVIKKVNYDTSRKMYTDSKYVKMAGNTMWNGCLMALDGVLKVREGKGRPSIGKYEEAVGKRDRKLLDFIVVGYNTMHLSMGYDGNLDRRVCDAGFDNAKAIIDRCAALYKA